MHLWHQEHQQLAQNSVGATKERGATAGVRGTRNASCVWQEQTTSVRAATRVIARRDDRHSSSYTARLRILLSHNLKIISCICK